MNETMPDLPCAVFDVVNLAFVPPLWYYAMNPIVDQIIEGKPLPRGHEKKVRWIAEAFTVGILTSIWYFVYQTYTSSA